MAEPELRFSGSVSRPMPRGTEKGKTARSNPAVASAANRLTGGIVIAALFMGSTILTPLYDLYRLAYGFSAFTLGRLSDQIGRKPVIFAAIGLAGLSAALFLQAHSLGWLFIARVISGLAVGMGSGAAAAWITEFTPAERRARAA